MDDFLTVLETTTKNFIIEETILGHLSDKTVVIATGSSELVRQSDYIYIMQDGAILEEGDFTKIRELEAYEKFKQKFEVK